MRKSEFDLHSFIVEGEGAFPLDMLRYDSCWPATSSDVNTMDGGDRRRVALATRNRHAPTVGRWESFLWRVVGEHP